MSNYLSIQKMLSTAPHTSTNFYSMDLCLGFSAALKVAWQAALTGLLCLTHDEAS